MRVFFSPHSWSYANVLCRGNKLVNVRPLVGGAHHEAFYLKNGRYCTYTFRHKKRYDCPSGIPKRFSCNPSIQNPFSLQISNYSDQPGANNGAKHREEEKLSLLQRFKQMYRDYWYVLVPVHVATSIAWFGGFYYIAKSGVDVADLLTSMGFGEKITSPLKDSSAGHLAVAYAMYKIATPARYTVTLGGTTVSINYLKQWGYIKPIPPKEKLKEMYAERKESMVESYREKKESMVESYREKKESMVESYRERKESVKSGLQDAKDTISHGLRQGLTPKKESTSKGMSESKDKNDGETKM